MSNRSTITPALIVLAVLLLTSVALVIAILIQRPEHRPIVWDMPTAFPASNYHTKTAAGFAEEVKACSHGRLQITIHANGSLFKGNEIKRVVQTGQAPLGENLLSIHANANAMFTVDSVPFIASSFEQSERLWQIAEQHMEALLASENMHLLYSVPWPPQGIYFKNAVNSIEDIAGLRFRSYSYATGRIAELAGMTPVLIEAAEINQALATGVVETMMASGSSGYDSKIWENLDFYYDIEAWRPRNYVLINKQTYDSVPATIRKCLDRAAVNAQASGTEESIRLGSWYLDQLRANGMKIVKPGPRFKADLDKIGDIMIDEWLSAAGLSGEKIIKAYRRCR